MITGVHDTLTQAPFGISFFISGEIISNSLNFFIRYDRFNPDNNYEASAIIYAKGYNSTNENLFLRVLIGPPISSVHISPNLWYNSYSSKTANASGKIKSDADIVPRLTVYYKF